VIIQNISINLSFTYRIMAQLRDSLQDKEHQHNFLFLECFELEQQLAEANAHRTESAAIDHWRSKV